MNSTVVNVLQQLIANVYAIRARTHHQHFATTSYAQHMALGSFYEEVEEILDDVIEAAIGQGFPIDSVTGATITFTLPSADKASTIAVVSAFRDFVDEAIETIEDSYEESNEEMNEASGDDYENLENEMLRFVQLSNQTIYKLQRLS